MKKETNHEYLLKLEKARRLYFEAIALIVKKAEKDDMALYLADLLIMGGCSLINSSTADKKKNKEYVLQLLEEISNANGW